MTFKTLFAVLLAILLMNFVNLSAQEIERYSLLKLNLKNRTQVLELKKLGISLESGPIVNNQIQIVVNRAEMDKIHKADFNFEVVIDDMNAHYEKNIKLSDEEMSTLQQEMKQKFSVSGFEYGSMGGYYTFEEVVSELDSMRLLYPHIISEKQSLGLSIEDRNIWHVKISDNVDSDEEEPEVLYTALHHAREPQSMMTVIYFMYYLLENYGKDPQVDYIVNNRELHFIPVLNPDGYVYNQTTRPGGGGMWRKNRRLNDDNSYGVDLNRNYGYEWAYSDIGSSPNPSSNEYRGTAPFSEPETQAIKNFCENHQIQLCFNYHTYGNVLIYPWGFNDQQTPDSVLYRALAQSLTEVNNYRYGTGSETIGYMVNGDSDDWMYGEQTTKNKIIAMTPEVGYAFWPNPADIYELAEENLEANIFLALGEGVIRTESSAMIQSASANVLFNTFSSDSLLLTTLITNPQAENLTVEMIMENQSLTFRDTLQLYDHGLQGDIFAGDNIFSNLVPAPDFEDIFNLHVTITDLGGGSDFLSFPSAFSTIGPIKLDYYEFISLDTIPNHGDQLAFTLYLKNEGFDSTARDVTTNLVSIDSCITTFGFPDRPYGDIDPGKTASHSGSHGIILSEETAACGNPLHAKLVIEISSKGSIFWYDTLAIVVTDLDHDAVTTPQTYELHNNYPNPFNPSTAIGYQLPAVSDVELSIYNILGQKVATLVSERQNAGIYQVQWDASGFSSGVYYYRIKASEFQDVKKMILLR